LQVIAYKLAIANKVQDIPHFWNVNEKAGIGWTRGFLSFFSIKGRTPASKTWKLSYVILRKSLVS